VPLILIGTGVGLPLVIFPFFEFSSEPDVVSMTEEEYIKHSQESLDNHSIMGSIAGDSQGGDYSGSDYGDAGSD